MRVQVDQGAFGMGLFGNSRDGRSEVREHGTMVQEKEGAQRVPPVPDREDLVFGVARENHVGRVDANRIKAGVYARPEGRRSLTRKGCAETVVCRSAEPAIGTHCSR